MPILIVLNNQPHTLPYVHVPIFQCVWLSIVLPSLSLPLADLPRSLEWSCLADGARASDEVLQVTPALTLRLPQEVLRGSLLGRWSHVRVLAFGGERCPSPAQISSWKHPEVRFDFWLLKWLIHLHVVSFADIKTYNCTYRISRTPQPYLTSMASPRCPAGPLATGSSPLASQAQRSTWTVCHVTCHVTCHVITRCQSETLCWTPGLSCWN